METDGRGRVHRESRAACVIHSRRNSNIGLFSPIATRHAAYDEWHGAGAGDPNKRLDFNALEGDEIRATAARGSHGGLSVLQGAILADFTGESRTVWERRPRPPTRYWIASVMISSVIDTTLRGVV